MVLEMMDTMAHTFRAFAPYMDAIGCATRNNPMVTSYIFSSSKYVVQSFPRAYKSKMLSKRSKEMKANCPNCRLDINGVPITYH